MRINKTFPFALAFSLCFSIGLASAEQTANAAPATNNVEQATTDTTQTPAPKPKPDANGYYVGGPVYVADNVKVWTRSGPSEGYRVTGSRSIGDELTFLRYSDNGRWAQLKKDEDTFWIPLESLTPQMCGAPLVDKLNGEIKDLEYRLANYDNELSRELKTAQEQLAILTKENANLKNTLSTKDATINELDELYREYADRLETKELDMQMRWWMQGAIIALCGAVAGVIFVFIPRPTRKQRRDRY